MSKLILLLSLLALAHTQGSFSNSYNPDRDGISATGDVDVTLNLLDAPLMDIAWCGKDKNVIFFLTEKNSIYRSVDDGHSGHKMTEYLQQLGKKELQTKNASMAGEVFSMLQSPVDPSVMLMLGSKGVNWVTDNCGETFRAMDQGRPVTEIQFHPTEKSWLLASAWTLCEDFEDGEPCKRYKEVFVTRDLGENWEVIEDYVFQFAWGYVTSESNPTSLIPKERIVITHDPTHKGHQKLNGWSEKLQVSYSDDFYKSSKVLAKGGNKFLLTSSFLFVVVANDEAEGVSLFVANSNDASYELRSINLPVKKLHEHSYTILDTTEHSVFLHINHDGDKSRSGSIYVSDSKGINYSLSLQRNVRDASGQCDFERLQGVDGIYLANVYEKKAIDNFKKRNMVEEIPTQNGGSKKVSAIADKGASNKGKKSTEIAIDAQKKSVEDFKKTVISFNKGGAWGPLTPPKTDSLGQRIVCDADEECSLHLHSISNSIFGPFYSSANSLGVILGTGNVGVHLSNKPDEINTYLSRDGGLTWTEIAKGSHIYEIGDHGSILLMASNQHAVTEVMLSWNEGLTWEYLKISDVPIEIENIIIEPTNTAEKFIIYGRAKDNTNKGVIIATDFTPRHPRWCQKINEPNTPESDYETWTPNGKISPSCLLGRQVQYIRKKRDAECFNSEEHEVWKFIKPCACTEEDWECDYGYTRTGSGPCLPQNDKVAPSNGVAPEQCFGHYTITQGYRKIGGNSCLGGVDHSPIQVQCPGTTVLSAKNFFLMGFLLLGVWGLMKFGNENNAQKAKDFFEILKSQTMSQISNLSSKLPKNLAKGPAGFRRIDEIPDSLREDDGHDFANIAFDDAEEVVGGHIAVEEDRSDDENDVIEKVKGKRMTGRNGYETATKHVPILNKPKGFAGI